MTTLEDKMKELSPARRKKVEARVRQIMAEEMTLRQLRSARQKTQVTVAKSLHMTQDGVSRLEKRSDLLLSTLRDYVAAMGGDLYLVAEFPDRERVILSGFGEVEDKPVKSRKTGRRGEHAGSHAT